LFGKRIKENVAIEYSLPEEGKTFNSLYFIPEYSNEDIGGTLVSMIYDPDLVYWGENFMDEIVRQFDPNGDTIIHSHFGDRQLLYTATNAQMANSKKDIDSIPILGLMLPIAGEIELLFYATTREYINYQNTFLQNSGDSRVKPIYNIKGGAGIFAGMLVDTFNVSLMPAFGYDGKYYSYAGAQDAYCRSYDLGTGKQKYEVDRRCIETWDKIIWCEIEHGKPEDPNLICGYDNFYINWPGIPSGELKKVLGMKNVITWCEFRDFPIEYYPLCGSAMVHLFNSGKKSFVLEREVKKWCKEHKDDVECLNVLPS